MSDAVIVALISAVALVMSGFLVELVRTRRQQDKTTAATQRVVEAVMPNHGSSLRDAVDRIERDVRELRDGQHRNGERLAVLEAYSVREH